MSLASLGDTVPVEYVRPVSEWFVRELVQLIVERDADLERMRSLGAGGVHLAAHREATRELQDVVDRWRRAITPEVTNPERRIL